MSKKRLIHISLAVVFILLILFVWQIAQDYHNEKRLQANLTSLEFFIPSPRSFFTAFRNNWDVIQIAMFATLQKSFFGFFIGATLAICVVSLYFMLPWLRSATLPMAYAINSVPVVGFAPIIVLAFGQGSFSTIAFLAAMVSYFPIVITLDSSIHNIDRKYVELLKVYNANSVQMLKYVYIPLTLPNFFIAIKLAIPASLIGAVIGEWMGSRTGIGNLMMICMYQLKPGLLYACLFQIAIVSSVIVLTLGIIKNKVLPWTKT